MGVVKKKEKPSWGMYEKVLAQICRYNLGDDRPAPSRAMTINGPLLRLAIQSGRRGWVYAFGIDGPLSIQTISELVAVGMVDQCYAYVDFEIADEEESAQQYCLWSLRHSFLNTPNLEFISPTYRELQAMRVREIDANKIALAMKTPKSDKKTMKSRRDVL